MDALALALGALGSIATIAVDGGPFGRAWMAATPEQARAALAAIFGAHATIFSIGISVTMLGLQNAAGQYTPRIVDLFVRMPHVRWVVSFFLFSAAFDLVAVWASGFTTMEARGARPSVAVAFLLLVVGAIALPYQILSTARAFQPDVVLARIADGTRAAVRRVASIRGDLRLAERMDDPPPDASPVIARATGYVGYDLRSALELARRHDFRIWFSPQVGAWIEAGERIGWIDGGARSWADRVAACAQVRDVHDAVLDVAFHVRLLGDVAIRAMSAGINDPTTARLALRRLRALLATLPTIGGTWTLVDERGEARVHVAILDEASCLSMALDGVVRYGALDPEVMEELVLLLRDVGTRAPALREAALQALRRVRDETRKALSPGRAARIGISIDRAEESIASGVRPDDLQPIGRFLFT